MPSARKKGRKPLVLSRNELLLTSFFYEKEKWRRRKIETKKTLQRERQSERVRERVRERE